ncbi:hypothetical protein K435DRAFT_867186 [Dendrothele bispora CBS 962.96]|uniref:Uncharacterized protein n=1 Tax=Dendrothele bispora (strain CBS 962.96) TaxID=1314807 RepID=A0A4S8LF17_DENBC|nr:hypothetical protein K435DRAFT_867186 [Dendrothele bispora CBS 962.96]
MKLNLITFLTVFSLKAVIAAPTVAPIGVMVWPFEIAIRFIILIYICLLMSPRINAMRPNFKRKEVDTNAPLLNEFWFELDERDVSKFKRKELDTNAPLVALWGKLDERDVSKIKRKELDTNAPLGVVWAKLDERDETLEM